MAESVTETAGFTQDLFSPLQFCEVVEEGQQQRQQQQHHIQQQQQLHQTHLSPHQLSNIQGSQQQHNNPQSQLQNQVQHDQIKQENSQQPNVQQHQSQTVNKEGTVINSIHSMDILLTTNPLQPITSTIVGYQEQQQLSHLYQVQLNRQQQMQHLHLNALELPNHQSQQSNVQHPQQPQPMQHQQTSVPSIIDSVSVALPLATVAKMKLPMTTAVGTQTTPMHQHQKENDDEPEIIFSSTGRVTAATPTVVSSSQSAVRPNGVSINTEKKVALTQHFQNNEVKPVPVKRTWRRPWKKKKEREKRQPVKKARRVKRRRIIVPKKHVIQIDSRNGPPIDTSNTVVQRDSEDSINQLKQKRQRIKLNRNSGREYINRLGKVVRARKIGSPCNCPLKCWERMGSKILEIFNNFWDLCDFNLQNSYLFTCLKLCDVKRRYTKKPAEESRRQNTFEYFVRISGKHLRVCKKAFMSSHGLTSDKRLRTLFTQMKDGALIPELDKRGKHTRPSKNHLGNSNHVTHDISGSHNKNSSNSKHRIKVTRKKTQPVRIETNKQTMYAPPTHPVGHLHPHCTPPPTAHGTTMQEPPHAYIPNGEIYFPGHYLEPPQSMAPHHMNQIPSCQKMLETPAYFMAGMKENTFHQ